MTDNYIYYLQNFVDFTKKTNLLHYQSLAYSSSSFSFSNAPALLNSHWVIYKLVRLKLKSTPINTTRFIDRPLSHKAIEQQISTWKRKDGIVAYTSRAEITAALRVGAARLQDRFARWFLGRHGKYHCDKGSDEYEGKFKKLHWSSTGICWRGGAHQHLYSANPPVFYTKILLKLFCHSSIQACDPQKSISTDSEVRLQLSMATATVFDPRLLESTAFKLPADYVTLPENYHPSPERFVGLLSCQSLL